MIRLLAMLSALPAFIQQPSVTQIHWMRPQVVDSPDRRWRLEVPRVNAKSEDAPVRLVERASGKSRLIWRMGRSADVLWRPDSQALLIVELYPERSSVALIAPGNPGRAFAIDALMHREMDRRVPKGFEYFYYEPRIVGWGADGAAKVVVETAFVPISGGSAHDGECRLFRLAVAPIKVLSSEELKGEDRRKLCS